MVPSVVVSAPSMSATVVVGSEPDTSESTATAKAWAKVVSEAASATRSFRVVWSGRPVSPESEPSTSARVVASQPGLGSVMPNCRVCRSAPG